MLLLVVSTLCQKNERQRVKLVIKSFRGSFSRKELVEGNVLGRKATQKVKSCNAIIGIQLNLLFLQAAQDFGHRTESFSLDFHEGCDPNFNFQQPWSS